MGNSFERLTESEKESISNKIDSLRLDILRIHGNFTEYRLTQSYMNIVRISKVKISVNE
jgi:hypothetical protein